MVVGRWLLVVGAPTYYATAGKLRFGRWSLVVGYWYEAK